MSFDIDANSDLHLICSLQFRKNWMKKQKHQEIIHSLQSQSNSLYQSILEIIKYSAYIQIYFLLTKYRLAMLKLATLDHFIPELSYNLLIFMCASLGMTTSYYSIFMEQPTINFSTYYCSPQILNANLDMKLLGRRTPRQINTELDFPRISLYAVSIFS